MINFDSPAALGLSLEGGVGMGISMSGMSGLGLTGSSMGGRTDDEDRRRKLDAVIATLKTRPGRVSEEGFKSFCEKNSLEPVVDEVKGGLRTFSTSFGERTIVEVTFRNDVVQNVTVGVAATDGTVDSNWSTAAKVFKQVLTPPPGVANVNLTLDHFAQNLDRIIRLDRLSTPDVSCFEAISGIYTSLRTLFEHEKKATMALFSTSTPNVNEKAEREVLCKRSGRPQMNAGKSIGLSLEYWMDRRFLHPNPPKSQQKAPSTSTDQSSHMDIDDTSDSHTDVESDTNNIYTLTVECEASPASLYHPIRVSDTWISPQVEKVAEDPSNIFGPSIDWLDPPQTYIQSAGADDHDAMNLGGNNSGVGRLPNIRFVAKLNPPLVVPLSVAVAIHQSLGNDIPNDAIRLTTFVDLALRPGEVDPAAVGLAGEATQEIRSERSVLVVGKNGQEQERRHTNSLYVPKTEYARVLDELPFHHPRQLVEIMPTLRQYAFLTSLLQSTFLSASPSPPTSTTPTTSTPPLQIDLSLHYAQPTPRIIINLPHPSSSTPSLTTSSKSLSPLDAILSDSAPPNPPITIAIDVLASAELLVAEQNVFPVPASLNGAGDGGEAAGREMRRQADVQKLGYALDMCGDVGVWAEWVRACVERAG